MKWRTEIKSGFQPKPKRAPVKKSLTDRLFDFIESFKPPKSTAEKVQDYLTEARGVSHMGRAAMLASALAAKKALDGTRQVEIPFPDHYLNGTTPIDDAARAELAAYAAALEEFAADLVTADTPLTQTVANGVNTWIVTMYSLAIPELTPLGKEIWLKLLEGAPNVDEAHRHLVRRAPTELEIQYFSYRPAALLR